MAKANPTIEEVTSEQNEDHQVGVETTDMDRRERIPTEKGDSLRLERLFEERKAAGAALRRQITKVSTLLESLKESDARVLEQERDSLDLCRDRMNDAHQNYYKELHDPKHSDEAYKWFDIRDREHLQCRMKINEALLSMERQTSDKMSLVSSKLSKRSSSSSVRSRRAKAAAKAACLEVEMDFLEREAEYKRLVMQKELAKARAEEETMRKIEEEERQEDFPQISKYEIPISDVKPKLPPKEEPSETKPLQDDGILNPKAPSVVPPNDPAGKSLSRESKSESYHRTDELTSVVKLVAEQQKLSMLPAQQPPVFSGNYFDYAAFISAFESLIECRVSDPKQRLYYLSQFTSGDAKESIQGLINLDHPDSYGKARQVLKERFGHPYRVAQAYKDKLNAWPPIKEGDGARLQQFADFLVLCEQAMKTLKYMEGLNSEDTLRRITSKLPNNMGAKWCRFANKTLKSEERLATFHDVVKFVTQEAALATDPVFSPEALKEARKNEFTSSSTSDNNNNRNTTWRNNGRRDKSASSFSTSATPHEDQPPPCSSCPFCNSQQHDLEKCSSFKKKTVQERRAFVQEARICFGCLCYGHMSRRCRNRKVCKTCSMPHPTVLHDESKISPKQSSEDQARVVQAAEATSSCTSTCNATGVTDAIMNSMIVPVRMYHQDNPERQVVIYALLDPASNGTFVKESVLEELQVNGVETQLKLNTMHGSEVVPTRRVSGLIVERMDREVHIKLPKTYSRNEIPSRRNEIPRPESAAKWPHLRHLANKIYPYQNNLQVGLLIGSNCPNAIKPKQVIPGRSSDPYAIRTLLGWGIIGPVTGSTTTEVSDVLCHRVAVKEICSEELPSHSFVVEARVKEIISPEAVKRMFERDFNEGKHVAQQTLSMDDRRFMAKVKEGIIHLSDGHYELPLPLRNESLALPNNEKLAVHRLQQLKLRFRRDEKYKEDYTAFMNDMIKKGYAEKIPKNEVRKDGKIWYLPHHGVFHPQKPDKIRVVFDCSAEYKGEALNKHLLQGPDLTNKLVGVLSRFRKEPVAFMADIEAMFLQVHVAERCRDLLRFLWWEDGDVNKEPTIYRMTVHLFGAGSSPGCCNFALKKTADDHEQKFGFEPAEFLRKDFYVDDGLKSVPSTSEAKELIRKTKEMCRRGGFNLHKFTSNKREVIESIPVEDRAKGIKELNLEKDELPMERALGVSWCIESDAFKFRIVMQDRPLTRRGILSTVSSVYDPLGFLAPLILTGKAILEDLCRGKVEWDDPIPENVRSRWLKWRDELHHLEDLSVRRCFKPEGFGTVMSTQLHHFSDASTTGYGQCSYVRLVDDKGQIHCSLIMGKARVAPLKMVTIPRLELTAAVVSVRISDMLRQELRYESVEEIFWTDSKVVLGYIKNDSKRFHVFVANRVQQIRDQTSPSQWRHVETKCNPADDASRGITAKELVESSRWISGPEFLWTPEDQWPQPLENQDLVTPSDDPEVKKVTSYATSTQEEWNLAESLSYFSDWHRACRAVAICLRYKQNLRQLVYSKKESCAEPVKCQQRPALTVEEILSAEREILKAAQKVAFSKEMGLLKPFQEGQDRSSAQQKKRAMKATSSLYRLDPFLDHDGVLRVGGRIQRGDFTDETKFPVILPRKGHVTGLIIKYYHEKVQHQGRGMSLNEIRANGFWVIGGTSAVASKIAKCVTCRKLRGAVQEQKMSDLPEDRLEPAPPFTYCAVDYCGPWYIKEGRKEVKKYVALFTCMASRAVHLEVSNSLETDSFLQALRRFICRRGPVRQLRSDQGTNFIGAKRELREALQSMDQGKISAEMLKENCDWMTFKMNPPSASHAGGVWERQIRTIRSVLSALLEKSASSLDGESFHTLICETEAIVNSRPLTVDNLSDPESLSPLTPNHFLTMKAKPVLPPPGVFQREDLYSRKRWRRVQHLACELWDRWRKEFLHSLQERCKWTRPRRNMQVGNVVIVKDDNKTRNRWSLARVIETYPNKADGLVRSVKVAIGDPHLSSTGKRVHPPSVLERPIQKLVLLLPREERPGFLHGEPLNEDIQKKD